MEFSVYSEFFSVQRTNFVYLVNLFPTCSSIVVLIPVKDTTDYFKNWQLEGHTGGTGRKAELLVLAGC